MTPGAENGRRPRGSLEPDAILAAAESLVDEHGAAPFTVTALARAMDVPVTSIYWHFRNRQDLIDELAQRARADLYDAVRPVTNDRPWDEQLVEHFAAIRQPLRRLSAILDVAADTPRRPGRPADERSINDQVDRVITMMTDAGIPRENAFRIYQLCTVYVRGFVIVERAGLRERAGDSALRSDAWLHYSGELPASQDLRPTWNWDERFHTGLRALVVGLKETDGAPRPVDAPLESGS